jgi:hypothetical protein
VRSYDNAGHSAPVAGATVTLGSVTAPTSADGTATVVPPAAGRMVLLAAKRGLVRSFPATVIAR